MTGYQSKRAAAQDKLDSMERKALKLALEALENSVDLVREYAYNAEKLYGNYPSRQGKIGGLKVLADDHEKAITAIKEALAQPAQEPVAWIQKDMECDDFDPDSVTCEKPARAADGWEWIPLYTTPPAAQPDQEPVAYWNFNSGFSHCMIDQLNEAAKKNPAPLYTNPPQPAHDAVALRREYQSGYYDGKKAALAGREWNFCERCGKRTADLTVIHTCTPPQENT